ncbi:MAG: 4Fe-4S dicluster domain-containing protein [Actinobacteria bacterium]|nr:4Fe-4S dicluster domain-containing protein [Actinomycetota bacterium]MCB8997241.1 4Fe-4S dicluster domain-containing protein [Actinomycetota bacterium]MCB9414619.1 4Fe-4S dicluster domain-containing protein [Actinomycetota bacterium]MCB9423553.1 4Fe-4S dicluster domain-containing protein [Actinomycetota bacterium]HRY09031.1 4Fe-4S dicluster domain-containing protein [Candidatus Nanopelagicales bacterium]
MAGVSVLDLAGLGALLDALHSRGYTVLGPTVRDGVITTGEVHTLEDLPRGVGDEQDAGHYRLRERGDDAIFGFAAPMQSAKQVFFPADELIWRGRRTPDGAFDVGHAQSDPAPVALFGVRSCDLAAVGVHDAVLDRREFVDTRYQARRDGTFVVAASCAEPAGTCFCVSMDTGPKPTGGYDIALTEILDGEHRFLAEAGTPAGEEVLAEVPAQPADYDDVAAADEVIDQARSRMGRTMRTDGLRDLLYASAQSPHWEDVANRCLACTNCTMVCPTCFCTSVEDVSDLTGDIDERHRVWDSCFSQEYSRLHTNFVRSTTAARYRQWATHKLASWQDQFGMSGCVGCGRCIAWCPAGIDITAEVAVLRGTALREAKG